MFIRLSLRVGHNLKSLSLILNFAVRLSLSGTVRLKVVYVY